MRRRNPNRRLRQVAAGATILLTLPWCARAAEHITLRNGFSVDCVRREPQGDKVRLFFTSASSDADAQNYLDVAAGSIVRIDPIADPGPQPKIPPAPPSGQVATAAATPDLHTLLSHAGAEHHIDSELLASVVHAESGGRIHAISRTGARGLMQLMPATAARVGVKDAFAPDQNIEGGSTYLDAMLTRYHDNIALALAAYNAGPAAVDRFHGVPPFRETRAYVSRVIREFNRRKALLLAQKQPLAINQPPQR